MCLFKVRQEEDVVVPYRVVHDRRRSPSPSRRRHSTHRVSRTEVIRESRPQSSTYITVPAPQPYAIPAPQPVPVFVAEPPPPPPPAPPSHHGGHHYVEVSPRSSVTSHSPSRHSEYVVHERETRRERVRDYSPESSPRYEHFRYVEPAPEDRYEQYDRRRSRSRVRSRSRGYGYDDHDPRGSVRETRERITIIDDDGRRRKEYRR
ncbi:hypothetical protein BCR34DRAFT_628067 [Clohesyomyces aquaticus]|uniref:Uncharacterized protein n=1 Tax=Clohesyomyces aquaticus TaxID=1231657 RepID=A0A1Y1YPR2_9PLEO|nr:hypothetical protein BCR34DRAFT_628067 [Clohesyomyces aquaticus]